MHQTHCCALSHQACSSADQRHAQCYTYQYQHQHAYKSFGREIARVCRACLMCTRGLCHRGGKMWLGIVIDKRLRNCIIDVCEWVCQQVFIKERVAKWQVLIGQEVHWGYCCWRHEYFCGIIWRIKCVPRHLNGRVFDDALRFG